MALTNLETVEVLAEVEVVTTVVVRWDFVTAMQVLTPELLEQVGGTQD
jgi:hypothetical protein